MKETVTLKVSGKSSCKAVAGSLSHFLKGDAENPPKDVVLSGGFSTSPVSFFERGC